MKRKIIKLSVVVSILVTIACAVIYFQTTRYLGILLGDILDTQSLTQIEIMEFTAWSDLGDIVQVEPQNTPDFAEELYAFKVRNRLSVPQVWSPTAYRTYQITLVDDQRKIAVLMIAENFVIVTSIPNFTRRAYTLIDPNGVYA